MLCGSPIFPKDRAAVCRESGCGSCNNTVSRSVILSGDSGVVSTTHPMSENRQINPIAVWELEKKRRFAKKELDGPGGFFWGQRFLGHFNRFFHFLFSRFQFGLDCPHLGINGVLNIGCGISKGAHGASEAFT